MLFNRTFYNATMNSTLSINGKVEGIALAIRFRHFHRKTAILSTKQKSRLFLKKLYKLTVYDIRGTLISKVFGNPAPIVYFYRPNS